MKQELLVWVLVLTTESIVPHLMGRLAGKV